MYGCEWLQESGAAVATGVETSNTGAVLDGDLDRFLAAALAYRIEGADAITANA